MARTTASSKSDRRISPGNNHTQPDEDEKTVVDLFKDMTRKQGDKRQSRRQRIVMEHKERLAKMRDDMRLGQAGTGSDDSSQPWGIRRVRQLDILKQLIQKKEGIESDIAKCASQLDMFVNTASSELKVTLEHRSDLANGLTQLDKPHT